MSFFPAGFDPRDEVVAAFTLVAIDTPDGVARFMPGIDGIFTDIDGNVWTGSTVLELSELEMSINGAAPGGKAGLSYFQDPAAPDLVAKIRALGDAYIRGRTLTIYVQPFTDMAQMHAPAIAPIQLARRYMTTLEFQAVGPDVRRISVNFEGPFEDRRAARRLYYNVADHSRVLGYANPSLQYMPTVDFQEQKLFG